ncbi:MAG: helix-turn-helix domain-containing protein [Streptosporangiaceae bacterium]
MDFPQALRDRRASRRLSQLDLAIRAGTTQRHLSFIESGRSVPGREMVVRLGESLGLPLRERNELLLAAGFAPAYAETPLDGAGLAPVRSALEHILAAHLPYPAIIVDRRGGLVGTNAARPILFDGASWPPCTPSSASTCPRPGSGPGTWASRSRSSSGRGTVSWP